MKNLISKLLIVSTQRLILVLFYHIFKFYPKNRSKSDWVIGVDGICGLSYEIAQILKAYSVCIFPDPFFDNLKYDFFIGNSRMAKIKRILLGPILLAYLTNLSNGFVYISDSRFLVSKYDFGEYESAFLKSKNKKIIFWFTGSDIRSILLGKTLKDENDFEDYTDIIPIYNPDVLSVGYDDKRRGLALVADKFGDLIYNFEQDQLSYIKSNTINTRVIISSEFFNLNTEKFYLDDNEKIRILHITSNPLIKGTPLVLSSINRLKKEGFSFDFEIIRGNLSRIELLMKLKKSHIILNQFYSKIPGHSGIEALANTNIVLQSATIPKDYKGASPWIVTHTFQIYENLKDVLTNFEKYIPISIAGYNYAVANSHPMHIKEEILREFSAIFNN